MKIILFITTPSETSLEKNLWKWEDGNGVPCTVLSFPSPADADGQWLVKTFKVLGCSELHDNAAWNYENLGKLVRDNAGNGECAVFMHTDSTRLQNLINKFTADSEKKNIVFIEYSSIYDRPYKTHINPFADEPNSTNFYSLWNAIVVEKKKENTVEQLCQWQQFPISRYALFLEGMRESAFVNFLEQSHDGTAGWPRYGGPPATG